MKRIEKAPSKEAGASARIPNPRTRWGEFLLGLRENSPVSSLMFLLVCTGWFTGAIALGTPSALRKGSVDDWTLDARDETGRLSAWIARMPTSQSGEQSVVLLGASDFRELSRDEDTLARMLQGQVQHPIKVFPLFCDALSMEMRLMVVEAIAEHQGVILVGINQRQMYRPVARARQLVGNLASRMAMEAPESERWLRELGFPIPRRTGLFAFDHRDFFLPRLRHLAAPSKAAAAFDPQVSRPGKVIDRAWILRLLSPEDSSAFERNVEMLRRMAELVRLRGRSELILVQIPGVHDVAPWASDPQFMAGSAAFEHKMRETAQALGISWISFHKECGLEASHFADPWHVTNAEAEERFSRELISRISQRIRDRIHSAP